MIKRAQTLLFLLTCLVISSCSSNKIWVSNRWKNGGKISYKGHLNLAQAEQLVPCTHFRFHKHKMEQSYKPHQHIPVYKSAIKDDPKKDSHVHFIRHNKENFWLKNTVTGSLDYECYEPRYMNRRDEYFNAYNKRYEKIKYLNETVKEN